MLRYPLTGLALLLALAGCAGQTRDDRSSGAASGAAPTAARPCGGIADTVNLHLRKSVVSAVKVEGQCTTVVLATTLAEEDYAAARQLCDTAAEVAYTGDVNAVVVLAGSGTELANGIAGARCLTPGG
ncbi:hypothetical protein [Longispora urticae]